MFFEFILNSRHVSDDSLLFTLKMFNLRMKKKQLLNLALPTYDEYWKRRSRRVSSSKFNTTWSSSLSHLVEVLADVLRREDLGLVADAVPRVVDVPLEGVDLERAGQVLAVAVDAALQTVPPAAGGGGKVTQVLICERNDNNFLFD